MWIKIASKKRKLQSPKGSNPKNLWYPCATLWKDQGKAFQAIAFLHAFQAGCCDYSPTKYPLRHSQATVYFGLSPDCFLRGVRASVS